MEGSFKIDRRVFGFLAANKLLCSYSDIECGYENSPITYKCLKNEQSVFNQPVTINTDSSMKDDFFTRMFSFTSFVVQ